jgi:hypothetical protein
VQNWGFIKDFFYGGEKMNKKIIFMMLGVLLFAGGLTQATTVGIGGVDILPIPPTNVDVITLNIFGSAATSSSHVEYDFFSQNGVSLQLDLYVKAGMLETPSNWTYSKQLQPLLPATYTLELKAFDYWTGTLQDTYATEFVVTPEPTTLAIFGFALPFIRAVIKKNQ